MYENGVSKYLIIRGGGFKSMLWRVLGKGIGEYERKR